MKPTRKLKLLLFSVLLIGACTNAENSIHLPEITFIGKQADVKVQEGDVITFHLLYKNDEGKLIANTRMMDGPVSIVRKDSIWQRSGLFYQVLGQLGEGDSVVFDLPANNFYEGAGEPLPKILDENDSLYFQLKVINVK